MSPSPRPSLRPFFAGLALLLAAAPARAQMTPILDGRELSARATFGAIQDGPTTAFPPAPFAAWNQFLNPFAEYPWSDPPPPAGSSTATAFQVSEFFPAAIYASGETSGNWQGELSGSYAARSLAAFTFRLDTCVDYTLYANLLPGGADSDGYITLSGSGAGLDYQHVTSGDHVLPGRLSAGTYTLEALSTLTSSAEDTPGPVYSMTFLCFPCTQPLIARQPADTVLNCGDPMTLTVLPTPPGSGLTYQWRFNGVPLVNGAHISGATTGALTIADACAADTGYYDVVVSNGTVVEPSRVAHVTLPGGTTGVPGPAPSGARLFTLEGAAPNPSAGATSFRYAARRPVTMSGSIHDAAGRLVRTLESRLASGAGSLAWDGRTATGAPAPPGIYFLRVRADGETQVRRFVRLR